MRACLILLLFLAGILQGSGQGADVPRNPSSCSAAFSCTVDPLDPMTIRFHDQSAGSITLWQWNFGDGTTTTGQNPSHTYALGGSYYVCLTVSNGTPGNLCHDVHCQMVTVHEPGRCIADFIAFPDLINPLKIRFDDHSSGHVTGWHWNFGDGSTSDDRNPQHTYAQPGRYQVCLTAYNPDSLSVCNNIKCDSVTAEAPAACHAQFGVRLDSANREPNTFIFSDQSTGNANRFLWRFGDGYSSENRNPVHQYKHSGQYTVCFTVRKEIQGQTVCKDSVCMPVSTAAYFDIGGHLFAGQYPINNPSPTGDTGVAYLYRSGTSGLTLYDSATFTKYGYFAFPRKLNGSYVVRAGLTGRSAGYERYFPAYCESTIHWKEAAGVDITHDNAYNADVHMPATVDTLSGTASIRGDVVLAGHDGPPEPVRGAEVILFDGGQQPLVFAVTGHDGQYTFDGLPFGTYNLYVEYPGRYSRLTTVWLDITAPVADSTRLELFYQDVTGFGEKITGAASIGNPWPNPAASHTTLPVTLEHGGSLTLRLSTIAGQTVWTGAFEASSGKSLALVPMAGLRAGLYLLTAKTAEGMVLGVKKVVRK